MRDDDPMGIGEYQRLVARTIPYVLGVAEQPGNPAPYDGELHPDDPTSRFVQWLREGKLECREGELWRLYEQRRGWLPEPVRSERQDARGYWTIRAYDSSVRRAVSTLSHRVVWTHFHGPLPPGAHINHKNGNKGDNRLINLEPVWPRDNARHAVDTGLHRGPRGSTNPNNKLTDEDLADIHLMGATGVKQAEIAEQFGVRPNQISRILSGHRRPMTFGVYQIMAGRTARADLDPRLRLLIAGLGVTGEAGEVADNLKKVVGHGHDLDREVLAKELSDVLWYLAELATVLGLSLDDVAWKNLVKLKRRYPQGFSSARSIHRSE